MGLRVPIVPGGHFPVTPAVADTSVDELLAMQGDDINHPSFRAVFEGDSEAAGLTLVRKAVAAGFAEIFADRDRAAAALGGEVLPARWVVSPTLGGMGAGSTA